MTSQKACFQGQISKVQTLFDSTLLLYYQVDELLPCSWKVCYFELYPGTNQCVKSSRKDLKMLLFWHFFDPPWSWLSLIITKINKKIKRYAACVNPLVEICICFYYSYQGVQNARITLTTLFRGSWFHSFKKSTVKTIRFLKNGGETRDCKLGSFLYH